MRHDSENRILFLNLSLNRIENRFVPTASWFESDGFDLGGELAELGY